MIFRVYTEFGTLSIVVGGKVWREVLPYATEAEIDEGNMRTGYDISFTRYFYRLPLFRTLAEICADIEALERETKGLPDEVLEEVYLA